MSNINYDLSPEERQAISVLAERADNLFKSLDDTKIEKFEKLGGDELNQLAAMGLIVSHTLPPKPTLTCLKALVITAYILGYERAEADSVKLNEDIWKL